MTLNAEHYALLREPLDPHLAARMSPDGKGKVSYIEAFVIIEQANRIFGYGNWGYELLREERDVDPETGAGIYSAWVRVTVAGCEPVVELGDCVLSVRQGNRANAAQKSMARKGAVTDGMKRGLRHFGDQFGNSLYDKDSDIHKQIDAAEREDQAASRTATAPAPRPAPIAAAVAQELTLHQQLEQMLKGAKTEDELKTAVAKVTAAKNNSLLDQATLKSLSAVYAARQKELASA